MQDLKQLSYVGQVMPTAKLRAAAERKRRPRDATDEKASQKHRSKQDLNDKHVVDDYA